MFEYIEFYTKNLSNFTILLLIGALIAILDITFRNVIKGVYLNVRDNIRKRHEIGGSDTTVREGMENNDEGGGGSGGGGGGSGGSSCPTECNAVAALQKRLTSLIESAARLQKDIQANNETIKRQHTTIEIMKKSIEDLSKKK
jgi:hypothetical protein